MVAAAREALGPVGVYLPIPFTSAPSTDLQREAAARLGRAGYPAVWTNETVGGKDPPRAVCLPPPSSATS